MTREYFFLWNESEWMSEWVSGCQRYGSLYSFYLTVLSDRYGLHSLSQFSNKFPTNLLPSIRINCLLLLSIFCFSSQSVSLSLSLSYFHDFICICFHNFERIFEYIVGVISKHSLELKLYVGVFYYLFIFISLSIVDFFYWKKRFNICKISFIFFFFALYYSVAWYFFFGAMKLD